MDTRHYQVAPWRRAQIEYIIPSELIKIFLSHYGKPSFIRVLPDFASGLYLNHINLLLNIFKIYIF
jgi:hypothetical protein